MKLSGDPQIPPNPCPNPILIRSPHCSPNLNLIPNLNPSPNLNHVPRARVRWKLRISRDCYKLQVGQLSQTNSAAAWVSFGKNISMKSVHLTSHYPTAQKTFRNAEPFLGVRISYRQSSNNMKCKDAGLFNK